MDNQLKSKTARRCKRAMRVRKRLRGTSEMPRLAVVKTNAHLHVQLIDDECGATLAGISTNGRDFKNTEYNRKNKTSAKQLGLTIAKLALNKKVKRVVFDRGAHKYHGVIAAVADGAREGGLEL